MCPCEIKSFFLTILQIPKHWLWTVRNCRLESFISILSSAIHVICYKIKERETCVRNVNSSWSCFRTASPPPQLGLVIVIGGRCRTFYPVREKVVGNAVCQVRTCHTCHGQNARDCRITHNDNVLFLAFCLL